MAQPKRTSTLEDSLQQRGILGASKLAQWQEDGNGWRYPVFNRDGAIIGYRKKLLDNPKYKYLWDGGKPDNPDAEWYVLPNTTDNIKSVQGVAYLANGEPSLLAMHAAGLTNSIATTETENRVPSNAIEYLQALGIKKLINICDNDKAGRDGSKKWRDALIDTDIEYVAKTWQGELGAKADANDAWIAVGYHRGQFLRMVNDAPALILPGYTKPETPKTVVDYSDKTSLISAVEATLEASYGLKRQYNAKGFTRRAFLCPHHNDQDKPSAGFNIESGVTNCFVCGSHSLNETAQILGIDWTQYGQEVQAIPRGHKDGLDAAPTDSATPSNIIQLPRRLTDRDKKRYTAEGQVQAIAQGQPLQPRSWFEQDAIPLGHLSAIMVLANSRAQVPLVFGRMHQAFRSGSLNWAAFTIKDVVNTLDLPDASVRKAITALEEWGFLSLLIPYTMYIDMLSKGVKNSSGGREPKVYTVNTDPEQLRKFLLDTLERYYTQKHYKNAIAPRTKMMASDMGITSFRDYQTWLRRNDTRTQDEANRKADTDFWQEFKGDGHEWAGWEKMLNRTDAVTVDWSRVSDTKTLRAQLFRAYCREVNQDNYLEDLERLLGCTAGTIYNMKKLAGVVSRENHIKPCEPYSNVKQQLIEACRENRGMPSWVGVSYIDDNGKKKWESFPTNARAINLDLVPKNPIEFSVNLQICSTYSAVPYILLYMGGYALQHWILECVSQELFDFEGQEDFWLGTDDLETEAEDTEQDDDIVELDDSDDDDAVSNGIAYDTDSHTWANYTNDWMLKQLQIEGFVYTGHWVQKTGWVVNLETGAKVHASAYEDILKTINALSGTKPLHTCLDFTEMLRLFRFMDDIEDELMIEVEILNSQLSETLKKRALDYYNALNGNISHSQVFAEIPAKPQLKVVNIKQPKEYTPTPIYRRENPHPNNRFAHMLPERPKDLEAA